MLIDKLVPYAYSVMMEPLSWVEKYYLYNNVDTTIQNQNVDSNTVTVSQMVLKTIFLTRVLALIRLFARNLWAAATLPCFMHIVILNKLFVSPSKNM